MKAPKQQYHFKELHKNLRLYAIVPNSTWVKCLVDLNVPSIQLRNKTNIKDELEQDIYSAIDYAKGSNSLLIINDYWRIALKHKAMGVHLGQGDLDKLNEADVVRLQSGGIYLGISTHSTNEINRVLQFNPSYIAIGSIFPTTTKEMPTAPQGIKKLAEFLQQIHIQNHRIKTLAIGGIDKENAGSVLSTGVGSIAVVRAITQSKNNIDLKKRVTELNNIVGEYLG